MWTCRKCGNENEKNFRFCWSCGLTRPEIKTEPKAKIPVEAPKPPEPAKREIVQNIPEPKEFINFNNDDDDVLPMLTRVSGGVHKKLRTDDVSLERKIFTIAVRLLGLFFVYQFLVAVPDLALMIYSALSAETNGAVNLLTSAFVIPALKSLFYLIVGIYLIGGGGVLLWLLSDR